MSKSRYKFNTKYLDSLVSHTVVMAEQLSDDKLYNLIDSLIQISWDREQASKDWVGNTDTILDSMDELIQDTKDDDHGNI